MKPSNSTLPRSNASAAKSRRSRIAAVLLTAAAAVQILTSCTVVQNISGAVPSSAGGSTAASQRPAGAEGPFQVKYVSDGDTIGVDMAGKTTTIRMIGIDTPEVKDPRKPVQCFGREASQHAHELLDNAQVWLEYDPAVDRKDRYDRTLAYVWLDQSTLINQAMLSEGFAHEYTYDNIAYKYQAAFKSSEQAAEDTGKGLWNPDTCAGDTSQPAR